MPPPCNKFQVLIFFCLFFCFIFAFSCSKSNTSNPSNLNQSQNKESFYTLKEVIDGDTIVLNDNRKVRYIGIDTPEFNIPAQKKYAEIALNENLKLVQNKNIILVYDSMYEDVYDRILGYVYAENVFVNEELVRKGYALVSTFPPNISHYKNFINAQIEARKNKTGFWDEQTLTPRDHTEAKNFIGQLCTIEGKVIETYNGKTKIFLNFGIDYKTDFTIIIYKNNFFLFYTENIDPLVSYTGKKIRTFGRIVEYNGPQIKVDNPFQIEIVGN